MKKYLLFDLDGTLTDPKEGITKCVQYALECGGIQEPDLDKLTPFIGPPLLDSFMTFYGMTETDAQKAIAAYRERFQDKGIFENALYPGIPHMLKHLKEQGIHLAVASSKPEIYVNRILEHFKIADYFQVVTGSNLDGTRTQKEEVVTEALRRLSEKSTEILRMEDVYMIGDRRYDIEGAKPLGMECVGVAYGYGSLEELKDAKADYIVKSVAELEKFLLRGADERPRKSGGSFGKIWDLLFPVLLFLLVRQAVNYALALFLIQMGTSAPEALHGVVFIYEDGNFAGLTGSTVTIMSAIAFAVAALSIRKQAVANIRWSANDMALSHIKPEPPRTYVLFAMASVGAVIGLNLLLELLQITDKSAAYQEARADQYSAVFLVGLICYGLITPIAEELLFRGILFNALRRMMKLKWAVIVSALCFGAYHWNTVQGVYGFLMGLLIAYAYLYFGNFMAAVAIHMVANLLAYSLSYSGISETSFISWPICVGFLLLTAGCLWLLDKQKKVW
jgi:phosphoglycolate phosphatase